VELVVEQSSEQQQIIELMKPINIVALLSGLLLLSSVVCLVIRIMHGPAWLATASGLLFFASALIAFIPLGCTLLFRVWKKINGNK
jgi:uncharacterized membrane protein